MNTLLKIAAAAAASLTITIVSNTQPVHAADTYYKVGKIRTTTPPAGGATGIPTLMGNFA